MTCLAKINKQKGRVRGAPAQAVFSAKVPTGLSLSQSGAPAPPRKPWKRAGALRKKLPIRLEGSAPQDVWQE